MNRAHIFPAILITLYLCAATVYAWDGDWRRVVYWLCAAGLNAAVTF
jgi:hypothetical protein